MSKEELTPLETLHSFDHWIQVEFAEQFKIIETALKDSEMEHTTRVRLENINYELVREKQENAKKLKALEIIIKKKVDIWKLYDAINVSADAWKGHELHFYNSYFKHPNEQYRKLTQEEFDLLKEVLK